MRHEFKLDGYEFQGNYSKETLELNCLSTGERWIENTPGNLTPAQITYFLEGMAEKYLEDWYKWLEMEDYLYNERTKNL